MGGRGLLTLRSHVPSSGLHCLSYRTDFPFLSGFYQATSFLLLSLGARDRNPSGMSCAFSLQVPSFVQLFTRNSGSGDVEKFTKNGGTHSGTERGLCTSQLQSAVWAQFGWSGFRLAMWGQQEQGAVGGDMGLRVGSKMGGQRLRG